MVKDFSATSGTVELLVNLAAGRVSEPPFPLRRRITCHLEKSGFPLERHVEDRTDTLIDFRFVSQMLKAARDPDRGVGDFALGVRVGLGARLPTSGTMQTETKMKVGGSREPRRVSGC